MTAQERTCELSNGVELAVTIDANLLLLSTAERVAVCLFIDELDRLERAAQSQNESWIVPLDPPADNAAKEAAQALEDVLVDAIKTTPAYEKAAALDDEPELDPFEVLDEDEAPPPIPAAIVPDGPAWRAATTPVAAWEHRLGLAICLKCNTTVGYRGKLAHERACWPADVEHRHHWKRSAPDGPVVHEACDCGESRDVPADPQEGFNYGNRSKSA